MNTLKAFSKGIAWALFFVALPLAIWTLGMNGHPIVALGVYCEPVDHDRVGRPGDDE